jgi:hypothetical protein
MFAGLKSTNKKKKSLSSIIGIIGICGISLATPASDQPSLDEHLEPLRPLLEKTYKGVFKNSKPDKPIADVQHWERALNGKAVRMTHSINDGIYGGETMFIWDKEKQSVVYYYFTTDDFMTIGTISFTNANWTTHEVVKGDSDGVTETRGSVELLADGSLHVKSDYFTKGEWKPGHEATYVPDTSAKVNFK